MNSESLIAGDTPDGTGSRGIEILRRVLFVGGILCAAWLVAAVGDPLWRVKDIRFDELQRSEAGRISGSLAMMGRESGAVPDSSLNLSLIHI